MRIFKEKYKEYNPKDYNYQELRRNNVTSMVQTWYNTLMDLKINVPDGIDPMLYAIELAYREHNRYGERMLPKLKNNIFSGYRYGFLLPPYRDSNPYNPKWTAEKKEQAAIEMLNYLVTKSIKPDTVMKWEKPEK